MEDITLFIHILCAAIWLGGGVISITFLLTSKNLSNENAKPILTNLANLGKFVFGPISILVLISGIGLISLGDWEFSDLWISLAFTGIIISIILGAVFHAKAGRKAIAASESGSKETLVKAIQSWLLIAYLDLAIITSVLAVMIFKPGV